jgi:hypothetical protein
MITIEKDEFTGIKTITSSTIGLRTNLLYEASNLNSDDFFELLYIEGESGQGRLVLRIHSYVGKYSINKEWPHWDDKFYLIVSGERLILNSSSINNFDTNSEMMIYDMPVDVFNKICFSQDVKFNLRGQNSDVKGTLNEFQLKIFKAFEQYCFGDENEGKKLLESIGSFVSSSNSSNNQNQGDTTTYYCHSCKANNIVPNSWDSFNCYSCKKDNVIVRPKELTDEERNNHENKVVDLIKTKKIEDAIKYYASNFGFTEDASKIKVKELAEKNGMASIYKKHETKNAIIGLVIIAVIVFVLFKACS